MNEFQERRIMANNLENCIRKAGKAKKEVAVAKGVTPETLSRHMHGRIQMTMLDAEEYARILNVPVQRILFKEEPIPVIGDCLIKEKQFSAPYMILKSTKFTSLARSEMTTLVFFGNVKCLIKVCGTIGMTLFS